MFLTCCPTCLSRLIFPTQLAERSGDTVVSRWCPECDHTDDVRVPTFVAATWCLRERRVATELLGLAEALADGLPVELSELSPS